MKTNLGNIHYPFNSKDLVGSLPIVAPCNAHTMPIQQHSSALAAQGFYGAGIAFKPFGHQFYSPVTGSLDSLPATCHQIRIRAKNGLMLHIEFGTDTQNLMAAGFKHAAKEKQKVKKGDLLFEFDLARMQHQLPDTLSFMTIVNSDKLSEIFPFYHQVIALEDPVMCIKSRSK